MFQTKHGAFDGQSWESLCQLIFKHKHAAEGYQFIPPDPGDFGLEGFTCKSGIGFQCYCPNDNYEKQELFNKQRTKITDDLKKLKQYSSQLAIRLGDTKIKEWHFVTPEINRNKLLVHARKKEIEVREWGLPILADDFTIHLRDADFYITEINHIRSAIGTAITFDTLPPTLQALSGPMQEYESNILRKSQLRLGSKAEGGEKSVAGLYQLTLNNFLESDPYLKKIESEAPTIFIRLVRLINEFETQVEEKKLTWIGEPEVLYETIKTDLSTMIHKDLGPQIDNTTATRISRLIVARWLAVCQLDFTNE